MFALRACGDTDMAADAVQTAFVRSWERITAGAEIGTFKPYIYRAVRNELLERMRRDRPTIDITAAGDVSDDDIYTSERDAALWQAIGRLPERCRDVFLMSKRDGMTYAEIAAELGISVKTVENQISKALARLREALAGPRKPFFLPFL